MIKPSFCIDEVNEFKAMMCKRPWIPLWDEKEHAASLKDALTVKLMERFINEDIVRNKNKKGSKNFDEQTPCLCTPCTCVFHSGIFFCRLVRTTTSFNLCRVHFLSYLPHIHTSLSCGYSLHKLPANWEKKLYI